MLREHSTCPFSNFKIISENQSIPTSNLLLFSTFRRDASVFRRCKADGQQGIEQSFSSVAHNQSVFSGSKRISLWCNIRRNQAVRTFRSFSGHSRRHRSIGQFKRQRHSSICSKYSM